jgi:hypothetical protein
MESVPGKEGLGLRFAELKLVHGRLGGVEALNINRFAVSGPDRITDVARAPRRKCSYACGSRTRSSARNLRATKKCPKSQEAVIAVATDRRRERLRSLRPGIIKLLPG